MSTPTVVSSSTGSTTTSGDFSVTAPASTANGDLLVAFQAAEGILSTTPATPAGWTLLGSTAWDGSSGFLACYYKVASSEPGSYTFHTGDGSISIVSIVNLSGADVAPDRHGENTGGPSTVAATVVYTAADDGKRMLACATCNNNTTIGSWTNSPTDLGATSLGSLPALSCDVVHLTFGSNPPDERATLGTSSNWATLLVSVPAPPAPAVRPVPPTVVSHPTPHPSYLE